VVRMTRSALAEVKDEQFAVDIQRIQQDSQHLMVLGIHVVDSFAGQSHRYTLPSPDSDLAPLVPYRAYPLCALQVIRFQVQGGSSI
jgi:hypothetical protein